MTNEQQETLSFLDEQVAIAAYDVFLIFEELSAVCERTLPGSSDQAIQLALNRVRSLRDGDLQRTVIDDPTLTKLVEEQEPKDEDSTPVESGSDLQEQQNSESPSA